MPLSTAAKAALCLCPPAVMAGTVATVPAAKRAVHHLTAPHRPVHRVATAAARPAAVVPADCEPAAGPLPAVPLVTYAAPIPEEPAGAPGGGPGAGAPGTSLGVLAAQAPVGTAAIAPPVATPPIGAVPVGPGPAVPEPASWLMLIVGAGALGATIRRQRGVALAGRHAAAGMTLWAGSAAEAGDVAMTGAIQSGAAKSVVASVAGKAMMCVCPAVVAAGSVVAVPPLRHAVHAATMPAPATAAPARVVPPCVPAATVPVSATAVPGFPDTVITQASVKASVEQPAGQALSPS